MKLEWIDKKVIRYGGYVDISVYEKPILRGFEVKKSSGRVFREKDKSLRQKGSI